MKSNCMQDIVNSGEQVNSMRSGLTFLPQDLKDRKLQQLT